MTRHDNDLQRRVLANARRRGVVIRTRAQWGSQPSGFRWPLAPNVDNVYRWRLRNRPVSRIEADTLVQHLTVTFDSGKLIGDFDADMRTIERIGFERFGSGFSYNFAADWRDGTIGVGMPLKAKGTHTVNDKSVPGYSHDQNLVARAIAWIGMPGMKPTEQARESVAQLVAAMIDEGALTIGHDYVPHSLFAFKDCPTQPARDAMPGIHKRALHVRRK